VWIAACRAEAAIYPDLLTHRSYDHPTVAPFLLVLLLFASAQAADKPKLTLDEFFNAVEITGVKISPDGHSVVIATDHAGWEQSIFRDDLWLYRDDSHGGGSLTQLTQSGYDSQPQWSPDGRWIAFLSARTGAKAGKTCQEASADHEVWQLYLISPAGGEAFPVTQGDEKVHAFAWSADSSTLYFATRTPWTKLQQEAYEKEWKDVCQYRAGERGDQVFSVSVADAIKRQASASSMVTDPEKISDGTPGARTLASTPWRIRQMTLSPDGQRLAFVTESVSERYERVEEFEIYSIDLANATPERPPHQLTHNEAIEQDIHWGKDSRHIFFQVDYGSVEGKYKDTQTRLYWVDADTGEVQRWAADFTGQVAHYELRFQPGRAAG
jgi:Tol biopolymer transport system component